MTDAEIEALLAELDYIAGQSKQARLDHFAGKYIDETVFYRSLATALRHSREELRAAREDVARLQRDAENCVEVPVTSENWWLVKVGPAAPDELPHGSDLPMRRAVEAAFEAITGHAPRAVFSGWGHHPTIHERAVIYNTVADEQSRNRAREAIDAARDASSASKEKT